jgi:hypothetical protein
MATANLGITLPTVGGSTDTWGTTLNTGITAIDALFSVSGTDVTMSDIKFNSMSVQETGTGTDAVKIQAPSAVTAYTLTMPGAVGSSGQVLRTTDGSGTLGWYTHDTTGSPLANTKIWIGSAAGVAAEFALSGDATMTNGGAVTVVAAPAGTLTGTTLKSTVVTSSLTSTGALNSGSITSGFGTVNIGSSALTAGAGSFTTLGATDDVTLAATKKLYLDGGNNTFINESAADTISLTTGGTQRWNVTSTGHLLAEGDNNYDIGASGSNRPRDVFIAGTTTGVAASFTTISGSTSLALASGATVTGIDNGALGSSATLLATQGAIKTYVDANVTAQDLDIVSDSGSIDIDLDSDSLTLTGGTGLASSASSTTVTFAIDATVATLSGSQTLTNKTIAGGSNTLSAIANGSLTNSTVAYGGVTLALGASDATPAFNLSDATAYTGDSALVTTGTITSGTWQGTTVAVNQGGTGLASYTAGDVIYASGSTTLAKLAKGSDTEVLTLASGVPTWAAPTTGDLTAIVAGAGLTGTSLGGPIPTLNVIGTADKITVSADAVTIASGYVGQSSITTLGTIGTGVWNGTAITGAYIDPTSSPLANTKIWIGSASNVAAEFALSGDATMSAGGAVTVSTAAACTGNAATATLASTVVVVDSTDATSSIAMFDSPTGSLAVKTDSGITYNSSTAALTATTFVGALTGSASGSSSSCTGNAATTTALATARTIGGTSFDGTANVAVALSATATALATARAINGVGFDGTAAVTVTAAAGTVTGATLNSGVTASSLTSVGTLTSLGVGNVTSTGNFVTSSNGSAAAAAVSVGGEAGTGLYQSGAAELAFAANGTVAFKVTSAGNLVGFGGSRDISGFRDIYLSEAARIGFVVAGSTTSTFGGDVTVTGAVSKGSGSFRIDHPLPAKTDTHHLVHSFIEGPQADLIYRGVAALSGGSASVDLDEAAGMTEGTWELLCRDPQVWIQNDSGWSKVRGSVEGSTLSIESQDAVSDDIVSWMVVAERCDPHMMDTGWTDDDGRVIVEPEKEQDGG